MMRPWHMPASSCCGLFSWEDGRRWRCGSCDPPPPGDLGERCIWAAALIRPARAPLAVVLPLVDRVPTKLDGLLWDDEEVQP